MAGPNGEQRQGHCGQILGISRLIHGHLGAQITVTWGRGLEKNHGHLGAQTYSKNL